MWPRLEWVVSEDAGNLGRPCLVVMVERWPSCDSQLDHDRWSMVGSTSTTSKGSHYLCSDWTQVAQPSPTGWSADLPQMAVLIPGRWYKDVWILYISANFDWVQVFRHSNDNDSYYCPLLWMGTRCCASNPVATVVTQLSKQVRSVGSFLQWLGATIVKV